MTITTGARLGPYEIVAPIGAGGMGEVFKARDTRLERSVAIKILPEEFAQDAQLRVRFEREAKTISQLNHPNICSLYDVGHENGTHFLVMELIEGDSLADRIARAPLPLDQVLRYGAQIADALEKAHRRGIIHRDLKPGNIMITKSGAKLLDFGLAKTSAERIPSILSGATEQKPLTAEGTIVGTFQYMAPEQLEGKEADARTDLFAFGAILYEMTTGKRAFDGKTKTSVIAAIVDREPPPISQFQPLTPPVFERLVRTCLAKDPDDRWQTAHDVALELRWISEGGSAAGLAAPVVGHRRNRERAGWALAAVAVLLGAAGWYLAAREIRKPVRVIRSTIAPPDKVTFAFDRGPMAISPDGRKIAFVARTANEPIIFIQSFDTLTATPLNGTQRAQYPFWSPDSRWLAFFADGKLKKIDVNGGPPQRLADVSAGRGGAWSRNDLIVFSPDARAALLAVPAAGGTVRQVTTLGTESTHRWPVFLPDGKHFLYIANLPGGVISSGDAAYVGSVEDPSVKKLLFHTNSNVVYADPGYLLYHRERTLMAQRFDAERLELSGEPAAVAEDVQFMASTGSAIFSVSGEGMLAYQTGTGGGMSYLDWFDLQGITTGRVGPSADFQRPRISPDGKRVAVDVIDPGSGNVDLWIYDLVRSTASRFTFDPGVDVNACWSPDGQRIIFNSTRKGPSALYEKATTGAGGEELLVQCKGFCLGSSWSRDGRFVAVQANDPKTRWDLHVWSVAEKKLTPVLIGDFNESSPYFSPNARWLAYSSDETGRSEIYVQAFPQGGRWQVSNNGGTHPIWSPDGRQIFFTSLDDKLMAASVRGDETFEPGEVRELFAAKLKGVPGRRYDLSPDGKRLLVSSAVAEELARPMILVVNWAEELKR